MVLDLLFFQSKNTSAEQMRNTRRVINEGDLMKYTTVYIKQLKRKGKPWQARAKYKDVNGKWKEVSKMLPEAKGKKEATRIANEWLNALNAEADMMPNAKHDSTVEEVYLNYIKNQLATGEIEKSTYTNNLSTFNKHIKPELGNYIFASVDKTIINAWLTNLYNKGLAQNSIHLIFTRLKKVYSYYYNNGDLLRDPFKGIKNPKKGKPKVTHLTNKQMDDVLEAVYADYGPEDAMYIGVLLPFYAGLRRGEICGLRWNDIDFLRHTITVRSAVGFSYGKGFGNYTKNPKNQSSNRTFPMMPQLENALLERKAAIKPLDSWFVVGEKEEFMKPIDYNHNFKKFVEEHNLVDAYGKKVVPHDLRHNFATVGIRAGADIASISLMMGHASRAMTLDIYGDANADALVAAGAKLTDTFNKNTEYFKLEEPEEEEEA